MDKMELHFEGFEVFFGGGFWMKNPNPAGFQHFLSIFGHPFSPSWPLGILKKTPALSPDACGFRQQCADVHLPS